MIPDAYALPQVVEYTLRPLYDPEIPLETFLSAQQASAVRSALKNATEDAWTSARQCLTGCISPDSGEAGFCASHVDKVAGTVSYECELPGDAAAQPPALPATPVQAVQRVAIALVEQPKLLGLSYLALGYNSLLGLPAHEQYGHQIRKPSEYMPDPRGLCLYLMIDL
jgi:hypothetical protein